MAKDLSLLQEIEQEQPLWIEQAENELAASPADHYEWMNDCDRWMIGKPADKACWAYYDKIGSGRKNKARIVMAMYAMGLPPPLNAIAALLLML
jgi:hypothetical protein